MMNQNAFIVITLLAYISACSIQIYGIVNRMAIKLFPIRLSAFIAISLHAYLLHSFIDVKHLQNLAFFNLFSLVAWLVALLVLITSLFRPIANLYIIAFPIAAISIVLALLFPGSYLIDTSANVKSLMHILLSTLAFSILCIAALQALVLAIQEWTLRHKQASLFIQILPPLATMEKVLFQLILLGFILLSAVLITSVLSFQPLWVAPLWQKLVLSLFAWLTFAILLIGRWFFGWRSRLAIQCTIGGVFLVMLTYYFGSAWL